MHMSNQQRYCVEKFLPTEDHENFMKLLHHLSFANLPLPHKNKSTVHSGRKSPVFNMSISAYSLSAVNQPSGSSGLKSKEVAALSSAAEAITEHPAVGPQSLCLCQGDTVRPLCC